MIVLDVEATGLDHSSCSLVSIGALEFENPENQFYKECRIDKGAKIEKKAMEILGLTEYELNNPRKPTSTQIIRSFVRWSKKIPNRTLLGQVVHFDFQWFQNAYFKNIIKEPLHYRLIDLHSVVITKMIELGVKVPEKEGVYNLGLTRICDFCGIPDEREYHNALQDVIIETELLYRLWYGVNKFDAYNDYPVPDYLKKR